MVKPKKILVPFGPGNRDLNAVHYALALAKRIKAQVLVLELSPESGAKDGEFIRVEEAMLDLESGARREGLYVSHHVAHGSFDKEIIGLMEQEGVDILVFNSDGSELDRLLSFSRSRIPGQVIGVKGKNDISYL